MVKIGFKKTILGLALGSFVTFILLPCSAQTISMGIVTDPQVLAAPLRSLDNASGKFLETALVDIKAVDAPTLHSQNGKTGIGSEERFGQGIIIDSSGIIATSKHIIINAQHIFVSLPGGKIYEANLLRNSQADLCLIKINAPFPLKAISLADTSNVEIGKNVIAIANAGFNPQRELAGQVIKIFEGKSSHNVEVLEINIPLKPGDSGGPILNEEGSLLGLIMGKQISDPSKSYAIASNRIEQEYFKYRNSILD